MALDEEYKLLSSAFPAASLPYIRRHHIADALSALPRRWLCLNRQLNLSTPIHTSFRTSSSQFHWLQSFVRQRLIG